MDPSAAALHMAPPHKTPSPQGSAPLEAVLDLALALNDHRRFGAASMEFCNRMASRLSADRVSLGWRRGAYIRLIASSHTDKLNPRLEESRLLRGAMEECMDQDDEVAWPAADGAAQLLHEHEAYARVAGGSHLLSVPLRLDQKTVGVATIERHGREFSADELEEARVAADLTARRLDDLRRRDLPAHVKVAEALRRVAGLLVGVEHTGARLGALAAVGVLAVVTLYPYPFRLGGEFTLQPETIFHLPAPFDGYVAEAFTRPGDAVREGDLNDKIGYPVTRGQALLKISKITGMYAKIMLPERLIPHLAPGLTGEAVFPSRPEAKHAFIVEEIEPMAVADEGGNFFVVRGRFAEGTPPAWWRPGMSGQARIQAGTRSLLWIVTNRAIDFLRMLLWL